MDGTVTVLVGTTKGAFLIDGGTERTGWHVRGPVVRAGRSTMWSAMPRAGRSGLAAAARGMGPGSGDHRIKAKAGRSRASPEAPLMIGPRMISILRQ